MKGLIEQAKAFYNLSLEDPVTAGTKYLADEFVLENYLPQHFPFGGRYEGRQGFLQYLTELSNAIEMGPLHMSDWCSDGPNVIVRGSEDSLVKATGRSYHMKYVHWLTFNDQGQLIHMHEYNDTAAMSAAFDT